jgi:hypothetical protein
MATHRFSHLLGQRGEIRTSAVSTEGFVACPVGLMIALPAQRHAEIERIYALAREQVRQANVPVRSYWANFSDN